MIYENCPDFKLGICTAYKDKTCKYAYHKACDNNYLCRDDNCKYGHGISIMKRTIISDMYDTIVNNDYDEKNDCLSLNHDRALLGRNLFLCFSLGLLSRP